ncbi:hypothetical protein BJX68DRAFT_240089 [Aspergillus pseudodeflectus]|uniref:SMP-30/Gluconolactonase/LRE-like region domain-containing protein n=1 Tax=Aspergillus pseudodeflectus TaxID=176178 RepID=A0ABR4K536_9EURO
MVSKILGSLVAVSFAALSAAAPENAISTIYQFPHGSWLENLETGPANSILTTRIDTPTLYQITTRAGSSSPCRPSGETTASAKLIQSFPGATGALGIVEYKTNHFAVVAGNYSLTTHESARGSYALWDVWFSGARLDRVSAKKIADIPEAGFLNGLTVLNKNKHAATLLVGDSWDGVVYSVNPETGDYDVVLADETLKPEEGQNLGVNGIHPVTIGHETFLYYTNSLKETVSRVQIDPVTGRAIGPYTTVATGVWGDDFTYDAATGDLYVAGNFENIVTQVNRNGHVEGIFGAETQLTVAGATSTLIQGQGRGKTLYVATGGALAAPVNGTITEGAKIVAIKLD